MVALRYIGEGRWTPGVPAADTDVAPEAVEALVSSGLYELSEDHPEDDPSVDHLIEEEDEVWTDLVATEVEEGVIPDGE